tara:strand:+ start:95125 stop:95436 length:312 start_codon:yes stop_codon:yes gene_type:complete
MKSTPIPRKLTPTLISPFHQTPTYSDPPLELLQLFAARLARLPTNSGFPTAVEAVQAGVLNFDRAKSKSDGKKDRAADNRDEGDGADHFFEHRNEWNHVTFCL